MFGAALKNLHHLQTFEEIGIVMTLKQVGDKSKIENIGKEAIFV